MRYGKESERINRVYFGDYTAISDLIDAVFLGYGIDLNGNKLNLTYAHRRDYYETVAKAGESEVARAFDEIIANFTQLKMSDNKVILNVIKEIFGDEFYNTLENTFNSFLK